MISLSYIPSSERLSETLTDRLKLIEDKYWKLTKEKIDIKIGQINRRTKQQDATNKYARA